MGFPFQIHNEAKGEKYGKLANEFRNQHTSFTYRETTTTLKNKVLNPGWYPYICWPHSIRLKKLKNSQQQISIFWFRRDLRLFDNAGLYQALKNNPAILPLFIFDTQILTKLADKADKRVQLIHQQLTQINEELAKLGRGLMVKHGTPQQIFLQLIKTYTITAVYTNHDYEPYSIQRDQEIGGLLKDHGITWMTYKDQVIFEKDEILKSNGTPYTVFTPYSKVWKANFTPEKTVPFPSETLLDHVLKTEYSGIPTLEEMGFISTQEKVPAPVISAHAISKYHETRNFPSLDATTRLSVHLRFGTVSVRHLVNQAWQLNETWVNELIWREFFMMILYHFPEVEKRSFKINYEAIVWRNNKKEFKKWCDGETGYPIVDAGMRELNETGFMHNRVRMIVASFLTKHLLIDWRWGEAYFAEKLLDYDLSANNGNWQWTAGCGCDAAPYFRIFNPYEQVKKFDPDLIYIKKWVKNLNELDYPSPMVEHSFARERVLKVYKAALQNE
jgi:deoxyribodipyrimidine photo-lyase